MAASGKLSQLPTYRFTSLAWCARHSSVTFWSGRSIASPSTSRASEALEKMK